MGLDLTQITVKSKEEIVTQLSELIHRHRRRYIKKYMRPCPVNCQFASVVRKGVTGCGKCESSNPESCRQEAYFAPISTKDEVAEEFSLDIRDPKILQHDYRDILTLLWVLGQFDGETPREHVIANAEKRQRKET
jgi:hypothetical protein